MGMAYIAILQCLHHHGGEQPWGKEKMSNPQKWHHFVYLSSPERLLESDEWTLPSLATPHPFLSLRSMQLRVVNTAKPSGMVKSRGAAGNRTLAEWKGQKQWCWGGKQPWGTKQWQQYDANDLAFRGLSLFSVVAGLRGRESQLWGVPAILSLSEETTWCCRECLPSCLCPGCHTELHGGGVHPFLCIKHLLF